MSDSLLTQWQRAMVNHPAADQFVRMSEKTKVAVMCQTMTMVAGGPKKTKDNPTGSWNFYFRVDETNNMLEVFGASHKLLRRYINFNFMNPEFPDPIDHLVDAIFK